MSKMHLMRHQAHGLLWQFPFESPPTDAQQAVLADYCLRLHGENHPKTGEPYAAWVEEVELLGPNDEPRAFIPVGGSSRDNSAGMPGNQASGVGHVSNPKEGS